MSAVGGGGNYISDGAILAWVTQQQNRMYGDLEGTMQQQELQGQMSSDLADIKLHLQALAKDPSKAKDVDVELSKFLDAYGSNPQFAEITETVTALAKDVHAQIAPGPVVVSTAASHSSSNPTSGYHMQGKAMVPNNPHAATSTSAPAPAPRPNLDADAIKNWTEALDKKLGAAGTNEQLGMVHINEVKSSIDQSTQIASQLIKSSNDSTSSVIHNIA